MRKGIDGFDHACSGPAAAGPLLAPPFRIPWPQSQPDQDRVLGWGRLCLFTMRVEHGVFLWPSNVEHGGTLALSSAQLSMLIDGIDWRAPERHWRPVIAG